MRFLSPGLVFIRGEALGATYHYVSMAALTSSKSRYSDSISTVIHSSILVFGFVRPSSRNRGTVSGTRTGIL